MFPEDASRKKLSRLTLNPLHKRGSNVPLITALLFWFYISFILQITPKTTFLPIHAIGEYYASLKTGKKIGQKLAILQPNFCPDSNLFEFNHNILWSNPTFSSLFLTQLVGFILHHYYTLNVP